LQCTLESLRPDLEKDVIAYIGRPECQGMNINIDKKYKREFNLFSTALVTGFECHEQLNQMRIPDTAASVRALGTDTMEEMNQTNMTALLKNPVGTNSCTALTPTGKPALTSYSPTRP
jgi:hypothetical protein